MKRYFGINSFLMIFLLVYHQPSSAVDCNSPPSGFGGSWARAYASWCQQCGGTYNSSNQSCNPGSNWGGGSTQAAPSYDYEAERQRQEAERQRQVEIERQRQKELEEQRKREEEAAARKKQEEFERNKQEAQRSMKGIAEGELGLKGTTDTGVMGLKGMDDTGGQSLKDAPNSAAAAKSKKVDCEWGNMGLHVVDLRCLGLDPDKYITIDPHVVRGKERVFPAQPDPKTFENANYQKGFAALMRFDFASAAEAVKHFKEAQKERPKDPLVRNGLLLAQDILQARLKKEKDDQAQATYFTLQSFAAMMMGENEKAQGYIAQARKFDPNNNNARFLASVAAIDLGPEGLSSDRKSAYRFVANSLMSARRRDFAVATVMLESAQKLQPRDQYIGILLDEIRKYDTRLVSTGGRK